jgi:hypothetical protein
MVTKALGHDAARPSIRRGILPTVLACGSPALLMGSRRRFSSRGGAQRGRAPGPSQSGPCVELCGDAERG